MEEKDKMNEVSEEVETPVEESTSEAVEPQEKETTEALREAYEAAQVSAPKGRRKITKGKIAVICVASFILLVGIAVGLFFLIGTLLAKDIDIPEGKYDPARPAAETTFSAEETAKITSALANVDTMSESEIKELIAMMYQKANYNKIHNADQAIAVLRGQGWATLEAVGASGSMAVRGFKVQAGSEFYYQKAAPIVDCDPKAAQPILEKSLPQQERAYTNGVNDFRLTGTLKGKYAKIKLDPAKNPLTLTLPFVPVDIPSKIKTYKKADFYENGFYREDPREITNFLITKDTIVLKPLEDGQKHIEYDAEKKLYTLRFSLLIEGEGHDECVEIARSYLRNSAKSDDLEYKKFDVTLEIWDNGYLKRMHDEEEWLGSASGATTSSKSWYESIIYYDFDETLFTEADAKAYAGDDWAAKIIAHYKEELDPITK